MKCTHDPIKTKGAIGMYHCPECGEMVVAGIEHPNYEEDKMTRKEIITDIENHLKNIKLRVNKEFDTMNRDMWNEIMAEVNRSLWLIDMIRLNDENLSKKV
jgi:hypothetical protein